MPTIFSENLKDQNKDSQWKSFLRKNNLNIEAEPIPFKAVINSVSGFILPLITAIKSKQNFSKTWNKSSWV